MQPLNFPGGIGAVFVGDVAVQQKDIPSLKGIVASLGFCIPFAAFT